MIQTFTWMTFSSEANFFLLFGRDTAVRIFPTVFADFKDQQGPRPVGGVTYNSYPYFNHRNIKDLLIYLNLVSTCQRKIF